MSKTYIIVVQPAGERKGPFLAILNVYSNTSNTTDSGIHMYSTPSSFKGNSK